MYIGLHESTRHSCQILMKRQFSRYIFEKCSNIKFHGNPPGLTDTSKLTVAFRNFANAPNKTTDFCDT